MRRLICGALGMAPIVSGAIVTDQMLRGRPFLGDTIGVFCSSVTNAAIGLNEIFGGL